MTDILGVIGGMGPMAGVYFCELVTGMTAASSDSEHLNMILYSLPKVPDRTAFLLGRVKESPAEAIIGIGNSLVGQGCKVIAIPCVTSFALYDEFAPKIDADVLHMPDETAAYLASLGVRKAGVLATAGTVSTGIFTRSCSKYGIETVVPDDDNQSAVMSVIYDQVKAGLPVDTDMFGRVCDHLLGRGAEKLILGCTELSLVFRGAHPEFCVDALEVLARASILKMGKQVR